MSDTSRFPRAEAAIVGIGCTEFSRDSGVGVFTLATRAVKAAVADAGLRLDDVDGLCTYGVNDSIAPNILAQAIGIQSLSFYVDQFYGGSVSLTMLGQATLALSAGVADCVVCYRALNGRSGVRVERLVGAAPGVSRGTCSSRRQPATSRRRRRSRWRRERTC